MLLLQVRKKKNFRMIVDFIDFIIRRYRIRSGTHKDCQVKKVKNILSGDAMLCHLEKVKV